MLRIDDGGVLRFTDSEGKVQILHPAILDPFGLHAAIVNTLGEYGSLAIQIDGSGVFTRMNGSQILLTPDMGLSLAPNGFGSPRVVKAGENHYLYLNGTYYQRFTVTEL